MQFIFIDQSKMQLRLLLSYDTQSDKVQIVLIRCNKAKKTKGKKLLPDENRRFDSFK